MAGMLTPADVAKQWACSPEHVQRLCARGELAALRLGRHWRISEQAVAAYEARHTATPTTADETPKPEASRRQEVQPGATAVAGLSLPELLSGAVITETIFARQGLGRLYVESILRKDFTMVQGLTLMIAVTYVLINLAVDVAYAAVDPRIQYE